ncbi:hypothetical protein AWV79_20280 [Cupriavidus sp. UYMMa02A]|nr:hypothetical protein AWV79_20280 [Cupriavidus sp. UYMMa02A]
MQKRSTWKGALAEANALVRALRAGEAEYRQVEEDLEDALDELRDYMGQRMLYDWDDDGEISRFVKEDRYE